MIRTEVAGGIAAKELPRLQRDHAEVLRLVEAVPGLRERISRNAAGGRAAGVVGA
jgi:hypothetical protein